MSLSLTPFESAFVEQRGIMAEEDGQPRIMGRIWGLLMMLEEPVTAAQMADLLQVSRGSISTNLKLLGMIDVIRKASKPGERETFYCIADEPYSSLTANMADRMQANCKMVERQLDGIEHPKARQRVKALAKFYRLAGEAQHDLLAKLK